MTDVYFYGLPFKVMKQPRISEACHHCWFRGSDKPCPNPNGEPVDYDNDDELYCVDQDTGDNTEETFFILDTPDGQADYIAKKLEGT